MNTVLFPGLVVPVSIGRPRSVQAVVAANASEERMIAVFTQRDAAVADPGPSDFFGFGVRALIRNFSAEGKTAELLLQGIDRLRLVEVIETDPYILAKVEVVPPVETEGAEVEALDRTVTEQASQALSMAGLGRHVDVAKLQAVERAQKAYFFASLFSLPVEKEQKLLEANSDREALDLMHDYLTHELAVLEIHNKIVSKSQEEISHFQKEQILRQQLATIRKELGEDREVPAEVTLLRERLSKAEIPDNIREEATRHLQHLEKLPPVAPDYQVTRSYLELILELPWVTTTPDLHDLPFARSVLDEDHHGLEKVKERILEYLAVMKLNPSAHAPILCFVGPPGTGKTSLGQSIARALGRKFERMSLGGMHDEAELRGHRRTYVGAMAGRIIQAVRRAKVKNPLLMLDEVDKLFHSFHGDPASALLEVLDPEQNREFHDNYLDLPFDLSQVFFITTANTTETIPRPLLDRMELIALSGYSPEEKLQIARLHVLPKQIREGGMTQENVEIPDETLLHLISHYTREAGVRQMERTIARLLRRVALRLTETGEQIGSISVTRAEELLGPEEFLVEMARSHLDPGVAAGLAWTESGGDILYVEVLFLPEDEELILTGSLGDVMKESAQTARSYILARAQSLGLEEGKARHAVHIHVPAGATPKDGPSAGLPMVCALASAISGQAVRSDTALTGEITLSGLVLPVGGIKEKVLAGHRAGIKHILIPRLNAKNLVDLPASLRADVDIVLIDRIEEAIHYAIPTLRRASQESATGQSSGNV